VVVIKKRGTVKSTRFTAPLTARVVLVRTDLFFARQRPRHLRASARRWARSWPIR
jgi:hypothetical protein